MPEEQAARPPPPSREHEERLEVFRAYAQEHFFERDCRAGSGVRLKVDAQVMLLWNLGLRGQARKRKPGGREGLRSGHGLLLFDHREAHEER